MIYLKKFALFSRLFLNISLGNDLLDDKCFQYFIANGRSFSSPKQRPFTTNKNMNFYANEKCDNTRIMISM